MPWDSLGFELVGSTNNGQSALDFVTRTRPHVVLTDIRMPKMDGLELLRIVRERFTNTKVVILSGYDDFSYAQAAIKLGVSDFLVKPVDADALAGALLKVRREIFDDPRILQENPATNTGETETENNGHRLVQRAETHIRQNFTRDISVEELSSLVGLSANYFSHLFKKTMGCGVKEYIHALRIAQAKKLLAESDLKIYEIAEQVGYTDYKHFSGVFKKVAGIAPTRLTERR